MQQHYPTDEIEAQEHGQREYDVDGHLTWRHRFAVCVHRRPDEDVVARNGVDGTDGQLKRQLSDAMTTHCYAPVVYAVVNCEQLTHKATTKFVRLSAALIIEINKLENKRTSESLKDRMDWINNWIHKFKINEWALLNDLYCNGECASSLWAMKTVVYIKVALYKFIVGLLHESWIHG